MEAKYKRVLLKISGEALAGDDHFGINEEMLKKVALQVKEITEGIDFFHDPILGRRREVFVERQYFREKIQILLDAELRIQQIIQWQVDQI